MNELNTVTAFSGVGLIVFLLGFLARQWWRSEHARGQDERRHSSELVRVNTDHDKELDELRTEIRSLRDRVDTLEASLDEERRLRRKAEDQAWRALRRTGEGDEP